MLPRPRRPRELHWYHAGPMLFGDWGTSRLYVLGLCFFYTHHASLWFMLAMSALLVLLGWAYSVICRLHPDGGGVYSSARERSQLLAVVGGLMLCADYIITASLSALDAFHYLDVPHPEWWAAASIAAIGIFNFFGPRKSGTGALVIAVLTVILTLVIASFAAPSLPRARIEPPQGNVWHIWTQFVSIILAVSGVEAVANMTGIMVRPVERTSKLAIYPVLVEIVVLNLVLTLAILAVPAEFLGNGNAADQYVAHRDDMLRALAEYYVGSRFAAAASLVFALLLLSAVNTALTGLVSIQFMMSRDGELPLKFMQLNGYGMPMLPLLLATAVPLTVLLLFPDVGHLADLYAIGVVGAITINLGATASVRRTDLASWERIGLALAGVLMLAIWLTIAITKVHALVFALCVLGVGLGTRWVVRHRSQLAQSIGRLPPSLRKAITPAPVETQASAPTPANGSEHKCAYEPKGIVMVAARGGNPRLLQFAVEEAKNRQAELRVLFVRQLAVLPMGPEEEVLDPNSDAEAQKVFAEAERLAREAGVPCRRVYTSSDNVAAMIADTAATHGADVLILGASQRGPFWKAMKGDVIQEVGAYLPDDMRLIIHA